MNTIMIRNADVQANITRDANNSIVPTIIINDKYEHTFDKDSRISKALSLVTTEELSNRLSGGSFFFVDDDLYDFRDGQYTGFVHTDESINQLVDRVGISDVASVRGVRVHENVTSRRITLGKMWSDHGIVVPGYQDGGEFSSQLHFGWNPFSKNIRSAFMLYRLVCENGMRGLRSFMSTKIPLFNRWEEHLDIANRQIQDKINGVVTRRVEQMGSERASVAEAGLIAGHASARIKDAVAMSQNEEQYVTNIVNIATPSLHLNNVYRDNVFVDTDIAAQLPSHLTTLDVYNMATELRTHTRETDKSTNHALDKLSNDLMFNHKNITVGQFSGAPKSSFSDPDAAFFGLMH